ncbi:hypothetical protein BC826DRAFT_625591 [Russula brevipes]|nr:hypothetical protein BC826DRAFT_625591 [Russula brevipes]
MDGNEDVGDEETFSHCGESDGSRAAAVCWPPAARGAGTFGFVVVDLGKFCLCADVRMCTYARREQANSQHEERLRDEKRKGNSERERERKQGRVALYLWTGPLRLRGGCAGATTAPRIIRSSAAGSVPRRQEGRRGRGSGAAAAGHERARAALRHGLPLARALPAHARARAGVRARDRLRLLLLLLPFQPLRLFRTLARPALLPPRPFCLGARAHVCALPAPLGVLRFVLGAPGFVLCGRDGEGRAWLLLLLLLFGCSCGG